MDINLKQINKLNYQFLSINFIIMKKNIWGLAALPLLAVLATSCANETIETKNSENVISYGIAAGKQTLSRADIVTKDDLEAGFDVLVHYTVSGSEYENSPLTVSYGTDWTYAGGPYYHPTNGLSHYAIFPEETPSSIDGQTAVFAYPVSGDTDLIAASATTTATGATADLMFKHLLSKINFVVAEMEDPTLTLVVSNIELVNLDNAASFTLTNTDSEGEWGTATGKNTDDAPYTYGIAADNDT